jgi:hypothetical protein
MVELTLELLRSELDQALDKGLEPVRSELAFIRARVTMVGSAVDVLQRDFRMIKAALNDIAKTSVTSGEFDALHEELATRPAPAGRA